MERSFSKPQKGTNTFTFPPAAEETILHSVGFFSIISSYPFDKCVWSMCQVTVPTEKKQKKTNSVRWEGQTPLNSTPSPAGMKPNFPRDLTSDELRSHAEEPTT